MAQQIKKHKGYDQVPEVSEKREFKEKQQGQEELSVQALQRDRHLRQRGSSPLTTCQLWW